MNDHDDEPFFEVVMRAAREGVSQAIEVHRRMGRSIVVMVDGEIKEIPPYDLVPRALPGDEFPPPVYLRPSGDAPP